MEPEHETLEEEKHVFFFENYIVFRFHAMLSFEGIFGT